MKVDYLMKPSSKLHPVRNALTGLAVGASLLFTGTLAGCGSATVAGGQSISPVVDSQEQPNIMMILLDDLGYTDLGVYGGEIETPYMDGLAGDGAQFTDFHATPLCAPTRAALMTGQDPHRVGLGSMEGMTPPGVPQTTPGYKGSLEGEYTGIAEVLGETGYDTYQVGKWHLGGEEGQTPQDLGFDRNFTLYDAGASYFADGLRLFDRKEAPFDQVIYERDGEGIDALPEDFFATRSYTDEMLGMIDESVQADEPFFAYLAYTAPHDPLHVENKELIDQYLEVYLDEYNYEELREQRIQNMAELGIIESDPDIRWPEQVPSWDSLSVEQREDLAYRMAVYAAVVHETDQQVGRVVERLKETGEYDDTLIVLASDNGAAPSTHAMYVGHTTEEGWHERAYPLLGDREAYGRQGSFPSMGIPNAQASSGPFYHAKNTLFEGGTRVPAIIKGPEASESDEPRIIDTFMHVTDLYPTFVDYAGADVAVGGELLGDSARPVMEGSSDDIGDDEFGWEHYGHRAYRSGDWKLIFTPEAMGGTGTYALYDLAVDPGETTDVSADYPEVVEELAQKWEGYARDNGVVIVDFEAVNEVAPTIAEAWSTIDWAEGALDE